MKFWTWLKKWAWLILAITAFVTGIVIAVCLGKGRQKSEPIQQFTKKAAEKVIELEEQAEVEKQKVRDEADEERKEVDEIKDDPQPVRRRRKLANWIAENI